MAAPDLHGPADPARWHDGSLDDGWPAPSRSMPPRPAAGAGPGGMALLAVLDEIDYGLALVAADGRVCFANHVALHECSTGFPMRLQSGRIEPRADEDVEPFRRALGGALTGRRSLLTVGAGAAAVSLAVVPAGDAALQPGGPTTLLVFGKRRLCEPLSIELYGQANRLTNAERSVLHGLCRGMSPAEIAAEGGVAISTVRTQVRNIRHKTGASSIAELVCRVTTLPPIVPTLERRRWPTGGTQGPRPIGMPA